MQECSLHIDYDRDMFKRTAPMPSLIRNRTDLVREIIAEAEEGPEQWNIPSYLCPTTPEVG